MLFNLTGISEGHSVCTQRLDIREIISRYWSANCFGELIISWGKFCCSNTIAAWSI